MTISTTTSVVTLSGNGVTTVFNFPFVGDDDLTIEVIYTDTNGAITILPASSYTLVINAPGVGQLWGVGGTVTYPNSGSPVVPIPTGSTITIKRIVPYEQNVSISNQGSFYPQAVEQGLDLLELQIQQIKTEVDYSIKAPESDLLPPTDLPSAAVRANTYLFFDAQGNPTTSTGVPASNSQIGTATDLVFLSGQASLGAADALAASRHGTLVIDMDWTLTSSQTLTSPTVLFTGGVITLGSFNLTFFSNTLQATAIRVFNQNSTGAVIGTFYTPFIYPEWWGAKSDGSSATATQAAFQAANDYVAQSDTKSATIRLLGKNYNIGSGAGIVKANSQFAPNWLGSGTGFGTQGTLITYTPAAEAAALTFIGGAGDSGGSVHGMTFTGNTNTVGVEINGQCFMDFDIAVTSPIKRAVLFHNKLTGQFTEFNRVKLYSTGGTLQTLVEYRVTSGNASFHGSGIIAGSVIAFNCDFPAILIGANAYVYNAPLQAVFFCVDGSGTNGIVVQNNSATGQGEGWFEGTVGIESQNSGTVTFGAGNQFFLNGPVDFFGNAHNFFMGTGYSIQSVRTLSNSQHQTFFAPISKLGTFSGTSALVASWPGDGDYNFYKAVIQINGTSYNAFVTVDVLFTEASGYTLSNQVNNTLTNGAGYGDIILAAGGTGLTATATSTPYVSGLKFYSTLIQIGQGSDHHDSQ